MKKLLTLMLTAMAFVAVLALVSPAVAEAEEADAKTLFVETHKCQMCHGVAEDQVREGGGP